MLKKMLKSVLPIALVIAMLFSQSALAAVTVDMVDMATKDDTVAIVLHGAEPNEMVTVLIYEDADADDVFDESENILYIWQVDADENGDATFSATFKAGTVNGAKAVAFGTQNNSNAGYFATDEITVADKLAVTYSLGDATGDAPTQEAVFAGTEITLAAAPAWEGYTFKGWNDGAATYDAGAAYTVNAATTLTAQWEANVVYYTVTYKNGDQVVHTEQVKAGGDVAQVPEVPAKEGYTGAWSADGTNIAADTVIEAVYTIKTYTVTFVGFENADLGTKTVEHGSAAEAPEAPVVEGYNFTGWDKAFDNVIGDLTVTAQYAIKTYTVTFVGFENADLGTKTVEHGSAAEAPEAPAVEGYTFAGWDKTFANVTEDLIVTAQYDINKYNVTFLDKDGAQIGDVQVVEHGSAAVAPEAPVVEGYDFTGWSVEFDNITEATTVQATYTIKTFAVTFVGFDNAELKVETVEYGAAATAPEAPAVEGYTFMNWDVDFSSIKADTTVTANYVINSYEVVFVDWNGTELKKESVNYGAAATAPEAPAREGYDFTGWDVAFDNIKADTTVTAQYEIKTYSVTYKADGVQVGEVQTVEHGANAVAPEVPAKEGYTGTWEADGTNITADTEINAVYEINKYTLTFTINGKVYGEATEVEYNAAIVAPKYEVEEGYIFSGWDVPATMPAEDLTIDATLAIQTFTVTWVVENVTVETDEDVAYGIQPTYDGATPTKAEDDEFTYTFKEWTPAITTVTGNATYTAVFDKVEKEATFVADFGEYADEITVKEKDENKYIELPEPKTTTNFVGWKLDGKLYAAKDTYELTGNVNFTATYVTISMLNASAIRLDKANPGIRFTTYVDEAGYAAVKDNATYGTLLALEEAIKTRKAAGLDDYTIEKIQSFNQNAEKPLRCANLTANYFYPNNDNDGKEEYRSVMIVAQTEANKEMYDLKWTARSYVTVTYADGDTATFYAEEYSADPKSVSAAALADTTQSYTDAQKAILNTYAGVTAE